MRNTLCLCKMLSFITCLSVPLPPHHASLPLLTPGKHEWISTLSTPQPPACHITGLPLACCSAVRWGSEGHGEVGGGEEGVGGRCQVAGLLCNPTNCPSTPSLHPLPGATHPGGTLPPYTSVSARPLWPGGTLTFAHLRWWWWQVGGWGGQQTLYLKVDWEWNGDETVLPSRLSSAPRLHELRVLW